MALELSLEGLLADLGLETILSVHLLEPLILLLKFLETLHHGSIHTAELGSPFIE